MAKNDEEKLTIAIVAKLTELEKQMARASAVTTKNYNSMQASSKRATRQMEIDAVRSTTRINQALATTSTKVGAFGKAYGASAFAFMRASALLALAPLLSVSAALAKAKSSLDEFDKIAKSAKATGLDGEFFQELSYHAELGGVGVDELSSALETFVKNSGLAVAGKGKMVTALKALDPVLLENIRNATTQEERLRAVADALDKEGSASRKAAIASALFGDSGTRMVEVLKGGSKAIDDTAEQARNLGIVIDRDVLANAEKMNDELSTATKVMDSQFSQALVDLAPLLIDAAKLAADVASAISRIVDSMRDLENQSTRGLNDQLAILGKERLDIETQILQKREEQRKLDPISAGLGGNDWINAEIDALKKQSDDLNGQEAKILGVLESRNKPTITAPTVAEVVTPLNTPPSRTGGSSRNSSARDAIKQADAVKTLIENLQYEQSLIGKTEVETAKMNALRQAGAAATEEQKRQIEGIIDATYREKAAHDANAESIQLQKDIVNGALTDMRTALEDGKITAKEWGDIFLNVLNKIIDKIQTNLVDALFSASTASSTSSSGGLGGLFSGLLGLLGGAAAPAHARGTDFAPGGPSLVGERGPEIVNLPRGSQVIPNHKLGSGLGGGNVSITSNVNLSVSGVGDKELLEKFRAGMNAALKKNNEHIYKEILPRRFRQIASDPRKVG